MFVAVKDNDRFLIGCTIRDTLDCMEYSDLVLEDNMPVWKVKGKKNVVVACGEIDFASTLLKYNKRLFDVEITDDGIFRELVPMMKRFLDRFDLVDDKGHWDNELIIANNDISYIIGPDFSVVKVDDYYCSAVYYNLVMGSLSTDKVKPAKKRIIDACALVEKMKARKMFPLAIYDTKTRKRKIVNPKG